MPSTEPTPPISTAHIAQQRLLQKRLEDLESEKSRLQEDYQRQLASALRHKEEHLQSSGKLENDLHRVEGERDSLSLKVQQLELQLGKMRNKVKELEGESVEMSKQVNDYMAKL